MPNYGMKRKLTPDLYAPPTENPDMKTGKHKGYCPKCDLFISTLDQTDSGYRCPRCKAKFETPNKKRSEAVVSW